MSTISVNNAWFYSYHGCLPEETIIGGEYIVSAEVEFETKTAEESDRLDKTIDYVDVYNCIKKEMEVPSKLLEAVLERIVLSIKSLHKNILFVDVSIKKINPPIGGCVDSVELRKKV
ncbi:MAG: dihydroneopterin aldolase [Bacteroidota bacterium]